MLEEDGQDVESLVDLAVSVDQVRVVHGQDVVDRDVDIDAAQAVLVLQQGHFDRRNVAQSAFLSDLLYDLAAVFDELVLVVCHPAVEHDDDVDVGATCSPESVHAGPGGCNRDFSLQEVRLPAAVSVVEGVFDSFDHLVPRVQV